MTGQLPVVLQERIPLDLNFLTLNGSRICDGMRSHNVVVRIWVSSDGVGGEVISETPLHILEAFYQVTSIAEGPYLAFAIDCHINSPITYPGEEATLLMFLANGATWISFAGQMLSLAAQDADGLLWVYEFLVS